MKRKNIMIIVAGIILTGIVLMYSSYALFTTSQISKSVVTIKVGTMNPTIKVDGIVANKLTVPAKTTKEFTVTVENLNQVSGKFLFYYIGTIPNGVTFGYLEQTGKNIPPRENGVVLAKSGKNTYTLYVSNTTTSSVTINLGSLGGLSNQPLSLPSNGHLIEKVEKPKNNNISNIYAYDQTKGSSTFCVTGEESTCLGIDPPSTYEVGTIIKYKVNDKETKYFHVMKDNGDTLTLQQRENTVDAKAWYTEKDNLQGPLDLLPELENVTKGWTNVLDQTYTLGTTIFEDNAYTGCRYDTEISINSTTAICEKNRYTLESRTAKSRLISVQEIISLNCSTRAKTCPLWMYNYLDKSSSNGGTIDATPIGYWTMNAVSTNLEYAWRIDSTGRLYSGSTNSPFGARAVVLIKKEDV